MALLGLVTLMGTTACNPRYGYKNHAPAPSTATPSGAYTLKVTAQSSNGVTSTTLSTALALTVE